jgi:tetratricopeptide (TPR) repeat protein
MSNEFNKLIHTAKQITLSEEKKGIIRARVQEFVEMTPIKKAPTAPLRSPFYLTKFSVMHFSKAVSLVLIVLIAGGGTMSYASEDTLPGDMFYTVKVNIKEPIEEGLAFSQQAKLEVKTKQVEKRLNEAQVLLERNDMSPEKHKEVEDRVEAKVNEISETIDKLQEKGDVETILATTGKLEPVLKAHQEALQEANDKEAVIEEGLLMESALLKTSIATEETFQVAETPSTEKLASTETKSHLTDNLLKTIERTIVQVEEKETKALETVANLENTDINNQRITDATDKKVLEATKEINQIKSDLQAITEVIDTTMANTATVDTTMTGTLESIDQALKNDAILLTITEAEILLAEAKTFFEQGLYKEALEKAQAAIKLTATIEATQKIEEVKETTQNKNEAEITPAPLPETPIEVLPEETIDQPLLPNEEVTSGKIEGTIQIEDQASQAIEALESKLKKDSIL